MTRPGVRKSEGFCNLSSTMPTRRKKSRQTSPLCIEEMEELPPALTPEQAQREEIAGYLEEAGFVASEELIADGIAEYQAHGGEGSNREIAGFIEREFF